MFCLIPKVANEFIEKMKSGEISPEKLNRMTSSERHNFFSEFMGDEAASKTNALFESKLLLKNQKQGMINWATQVSGLKPAIRKDIISRVNSMEKILTPSEQTAFLHDLASQRLGVSVSVEEASKIADLAKKVEATKENALNGKDRMAHGRALVEFHNYLNSIKELSQKITFQDLKKNPGATTLKALSNTAGLAKSLKASLDNSVIGRQGLRVLLTSPGIWARNSLKTFVDMVRQFGSKNVMDEIQADVFSRENALNGLYKKEKLAIGLQEEAYPTNLPEKIPFLGRFFKASETAYKGFLLRTRADVFDKYVEIAKKTGGEIDGLGKLVNSLTGRANLGGLERSANTINNVFFSPRNLKSHFDVLTAHAFDSNISPFARKQAALNLLKIISGISGVLAIADALKPGSAEHDSRSSDFGKIKIGNTRFDVSGGMSSLVVLASRLITMSSKSSMNHKIRPLNSKKFGAQTGTDVIYNFFENKLSPAAGILRNLLKGQDFDGNKPTLAGELKNTFVPLPISNYEELSKDPNAAPIIIAMIADALGIGTNTYSKHRKKHN